MNKAICRTFSTDITIHHCQIHKTHNITERIRAHIAAQYGVGYSHSGCIKLLARLGYEYRKPKGLPRVASAEKPYTSPMLCIPSIRQSLRLAGSRQDQTPP